MHKGKYVFTQLLDFLDRNDFNYLARKYGGDKYVKQFTCYNQLCVLMFGQLSNRESLRDVILATQAHASKAYHLGFGKHAAEWALFRKKKGGIKMHTLYNLETQIPTLFHITPAKVHDTKAMDEIPYEENSFYIFDRAYNDFGRLFTINGVRAYFVVRGKKKFIFFTNAMTISPVMVAELYHNRWQIELFFKWIKQHLKIKKFWGTSENAVRIQIYSAIIAYCMMAIVQKKMNVERSIYEMLQIVSISLTDATPLKDLFAKPNYNIVNELDDSTEPSLF